MPLTIPTLDNRRYQQLLDEALARIPVHNPEWTNFNHSDPGVTLIEVFAFLTESLLYRCNQIPERNRRKFLSLLGVPLQPASSARGLVTFTNERGPRETLVLTSGLEVRAGQVPFRTDQGLDVLPVDARAFYKRAVPDPPEAIREYYRQLYASFRGQPPTADLRLYETAPFPPSGTDANDAGSLEAVDGAVWMALLLRDSDPHDEDTKRDVRERIAGKTLSLGIIPIVTDAERRLRAAGIAGAPAQAPLRFQLPRIPPGGSLPTRLADRAPQYRDLEPRTTVDVFAEPGIVQLTLPSASELALWTNLDPLESGAADFPPSLEDTNLARRLLTWLRLQSSPALPSQMQWIGINSTTVRQRAHIANETLPDGTGEPDQSCVLSRRPVLAQSVRLRVTLDNVTREWIEIDDLWNAGPEVPIQDPKDPPGTPPRKSGPSEVFAVNLEAGEIRFGDGLHGARPPLGAALRVDYDYGVGRGGNVGPGAIDSSGALPAGIRVSNPDRTWGGTEAETVAEGEKQIARHLQHRDRLVTAADFEAITLRTPGVALGRVDVIPAYNPDLPLNEPGDAPGAVTVMVIPQSNPLQPDAPRPDKLVLNTIAAYLDDRRLVSTEIFLRGPVYKPIWISVGIAAIAGTSVAEVREAVRGALADFLSPLPPAGIASIDELATGLRPHHVERRRGWPLRKAVLALELQAVANRVDGVLLVNELRIAEGSGAPQPQIRFTGLELPRVAGISVVIGDAVDLDQVRGQSAGDPGTSSLLVPVPIVPEEC
jgi:hypothetical protein